MEGELVIKDLSGWLIPKGPVNPTVIVCEMENLGTW